MQCRICLDEATEESLVSPCKCIGTSRYVHTSCLEQWRNATGKVSCEVCKSPYVFYRHEYVLQLSRLLCMIPVLSYYLSSTYIFTKILLFAGLHPDAPKSMMTPHLLFEICLPFGPLVLLAADSLLYKYYRPRFVFAWFILNVVTNALPAEPLLFGSDLIFVFCTFFGFYLLLLHSTRTASYLAPRVLVIWHDLHSFDR
ncbi:hypothetical protein EDD86DRAFT_4216 [Gorgonomyces haynaldii]|nr:hypothetical protein EDD86DRAFT_4216 [Gorgonomyces haynaldii]